MTRLILIVLLLAGCEARDEISIPFSVEFGGTDIDCEQTQPRLSDLRLFLHDIELLTEQGQAVAATPVADGRWQSDRVVLIDLETARGACDDGTRELYSTVLASVPPGPYRGLRFTLGIPFDLNHGDPLTAEPPLDDPAMHWHWRSGYKFLRAGVETDNDGFWLHLGSTGCEGTTGNIRGCKQPNRFVVTLDTFEPGRDEVRIDLARLFAGVYFDDGQASDCSSGPTEASCDVVLATLAAADTRAEVFRSARPAP